MKIKTTLLELLGYSFNLTGIFSIPMIFSDVQRTPKEFAYAIICILLGQIILWYERKLEDHRDLFVKRHDWKVLYGFGILCLCNSLNSCLSFHIEDITYSMATGFANFMCSVYLFVCAGRRKKRTQVKTYIEVPHDPNTGSALKIGDKVRIKELEGDFVYRGMKPKRKCICHNVKKDEIIEGTLLSIYFDDQIIEETQKEAPKSDNLNLKEDKENHRRFMPK